MKTEQQIQKEIDEKIELIKELYSYKDKAAATKRKKATEQMRFLKEVKVYIQSGVNEDYLKKTILSISNRIKKILTHYEPLDSERFKPSEIRKHKAKFDALWEISKLRKQISALSYILNK